MSIARCIAISDVHLDAWLEAEEKYQAFVDFLEWVRQDSGAQALAIVGDLLDVPQPDRSSLWPRFRDLFGRLWKHIQSGQSVYWIVGNHDAGLMGLDIAIAKPPFTLAYPSVTLQCGDRLIWLEHGHQLDSWLWAFLQHKCAQLSTLPLEQAMAHFGANDEYTAPVWPAMKFFHETLYEAMQWRALETGFTLEEKSLGIKIMSQHLQDTFSDVASAGELPAVHSEILARLEQEGVSVTQLQQGEFPLELLDLFVLLGQRYYSPLPWRRAAQGRLRSLRQNNAQLNTLLFGHIHHCDVFSWTENGEAFVYANCGTWLGESGSFVCIDEAQVRAFCRSWRDPLPEL